MPAELELDAKAVLGVPGVVCVTPRPRQPTDNGRGSNRKIVRVGDAAGWLIPSGIAAWERELSFVARAEMTVELARALRATMPHEQIAPKRYPFAGRAVDVSPLLALTSNLVDDARKQGARVHTLGVDRVSSDFYYFAEGGKGPPVNVQGNLIEMLAPSLGASSTNEDIDTLLQGLLDRLLIRFSDGAVSELEVELADALPRLARHGTGLEGTDLDAFDARAQSLSEHSIRFAPGARRLADAIAEATRFGRPAIRVPLYGEAQNEARGALEILVGGETLRLPPAPVWTVRGEPVEAREERPSQRPPMVAGAGAQMPRSEEFPRSRGAGSAPTPPQQPKAAPVRVDEAPSSSVAAVSPAIAFAPLASPAAAPAPAAEAPTAAAPAPVASVAVAAPSEPAPAPAGSPSSAIAPEEPARPAEIAAAETSKEESPLVITRPVVVVTAKEEPAARARKSDAPPAKAAKVKPKSKAADSKPAVRAGSKAATARSAKRGQARAEAMKSFTLFVIGLLAFVGALAYSAWRWAQWHRLH